MKINDAIASRKYKSLHKQQVMNRKCSATVSALPTNTDRYKTHIRTLSSSEISCLYRLLEFKTDQQPTTQRALIHINGTNHAT